MPTYRSAIQWKYVFQVIGYGTLTEQRKYHLFRVSSCWRTQLAHHTYDHRAISHIILYYEILKSQGSDPKVFNAYHNG
jgi:hypothetical protein